MKKTLSGAMATRQALISTSLSLFGEHGYDAVSTRQIADQAAANIGSIAYHFGGKPGLRLACAEYVVSTIIEAMGDALGRPLTNDITPEAATLMLEDILATFIRSSTERPDSLEITRFIMREMLQPGEVLVYLERELTGPLHARMCQLLAVATGERADTCAMRALVFTLIGQTMHFKNCQAVVLHQMGWCEFGPKQSQLVIDTLKDNLRAIISYHRAGKATSPQKHLELLDR